MSEYSVEEVHELVEDLMSCCRCIGYATSGNERASHISAAKAAKEKLISAYTRPPAQADEEAVPVAFIAVGNMSGQKVISDNIEWGKQFEHPQSVKNGWKLEWLFARPPAQAAQVDQCGWLIENGKNVPDLRYRCMRQGRIEWTADHNEALRFARRADAESFAEEDEDAWRIVEHGWHAPTAEPVAQLECPKCHGTGEVSDCDGLYAGQCTACRSAEPVAQGEAVKRWPFVEAPGEFTSRLQAAMREFPLLGAVRHVLIEDPPTLAAQPRAVPDVLRETLESIVAADPRKWEELSEPEGEFERWAKSRARHALAAAPSPGESA